MTAPPEEDSNKLPTDMQVIGAVQRSARENTVVMCAAGTMPGELHKLWKAGRPMSYHMEYGYSCMGYEIAGGIGIKMAEPDRDVVVMVGDGSYMMLNSELATAAMMGIEMTVVVTDNRGFGCINRLQMATGGAEFNNLLDHAVHETPSHIDFVAHAASMGARAEKAAGIAGAGSGPGAGTGRRLQGAERHRHRHRSLSVDRGGRATGGMSRFRRCRNGKRSARRARPTRRRGSTSARQTDPNEGEDDHDPLRHEPHRVVQRRRPLARRRISASNNACARRPRSASTASKRATRCRATARS